MWPGAFDRGAAAPENEGSPLNAEGGAGLRRLGPEGDRSSVVLLNRRWPFATGSASFQSIALMHE
jgi:hypothetical protein